MKKRFAFKTQILALAVLFGASYSANGQINVGPVKSPDATNASSQDPNFLSIIGNPDPIGKNFRESVQKVTVLKMKLREAISTKDEKIISETKSEVKSALNEHFDRELAVQESILANLSKRADSTASQNQQRRTSKDELIELQLQSFVMDKDTLGLGATGLESNSRYPVGEDVPTTGNPFFGTRTATNPSTVTNLVNPNHAPSVSGPTPGSLRTLPQQNPKAMIETARLKLAGAASAEEESKATQELKEALSAYFNRDLGERDRLLKMVLADIEKVKQKLEKRASSKSSIVDLQFKMIVNEANGLGFFSPPVTKDRFDDPKPLSGSSLEPR